MFVKATIEFFEGMTGKIYENDDEANVDERSALFRMKRITVLLADDHTIVREGIKTLLRGEKDVDVVGEAETGRQAVQLAKKLLPDVVIMDIAMPLLNGLEATRQILRMTPNTKVIILSAHSDDSHVEQVMAAGASGYLIKQTSAQILCKAIREVQKGNSFFSPSISERICNLYQKPSEEKKGLCCLSSREMEVLQLIAEGKANKQIAAELDISIKTVEKHRQNLILKLDIHDTASLTRYAIAAGIIEGSAQRAFH